ncbi:MAG: hypothetical protein J0L55_11025 [Caulobacterales bacterium]|nr:hypothetical protein [Caulobacterales bacterium]MCA0371279.1 hypothetical protein [Pseudomonadota bacterium]
MKPKILKLNIPEPLPKDFDPLLGRSVGDYLRALNRTPSSETKHSEGSVFDDPDFDFSFRESAPVQPILDDDIVKNTPAEITPFETMDGHANATIDEAILEDNLSEKWTFENEAQEKEALEKEEFEASYQSITEEIIIETQIIEEAPIEEIIAQETTETDAAQIYEEDAIINSDIQTNEIIETEAIISELTVEETETIDNPQEFISEPIQEQTIIEEAPNALLEIEKVQQEEEQQDYEEIQEAAQEVARAPIIEPVDNIQIAKPRKPKAKNIAKSRKVTKQTKQQIIISYFVGTFALGLSAISLIMSLLAPLGKPFEDFAAFDFYWAFLAIIGLAAWAYGKSIQGVIAGAILFLIYGIILAPNLGQFPSGGNKNPIIIGWANLENSQKSLDAVLKQAEERHASLLMLAGSNGLTNAPNGWELIEAPNEKDPTALAVLSKGNWRATTLPDEPTMARPLDNSITVIGVNPIDKSNTKRQSPEREALINRTANRAGNEDVPVLTIGDFAAPAWDRQMKFFARTAQVNRIVCGGITGSTQSKFPFSVAFDHAFSRGLKIQKCDVGSRLPQGGHSPLWISVEGKGA